ncbi:MAG: DUF2188 domain-containing protein [Candidatus Izemoplasmataceae bacterium]
MPWTLNDYPNAMKNLEQEVKEKAIEIANELVEEGYEDGRAISIAIDRAKNWFSNRGESVSDDVTHRLKPSNDTWLLESIDGNESWTFDTKEDAMEKVKSLSKNREMKVMIHDAKGKFQKVY